MDVALASCVQLPEADPDEAPLLAALRARGLDAATLAWDDGASGFSRARLTLLRATWNYPQQPARFASWIDAVSAQTSLWNPAPVVRWNVHKRYLLDLAARGIPIVPSELVPLHASDSLGAICERRGFAEVVIKPAISAGSAGTRRFTPQERAHGEAHLRALCARGDALVQPYLPAVEARGERSLIWIDGEITHAVRKAPRFAGESESITAADDLSSAERELALRAVAAAPAPIFYARADLVGGPDGQPRLMELELIEPSLFFAQSVRALQRFVDGVLARLAAVSG
jgi:hypothetical protein